MRPIHRLATSAALVLLVVLLGACSREKLESAGPTSFSQAPPASAQGVQAGDVEAAATESTPPASGPDEEPAPDAESHVTPAPEPSAESDPVAQPNPEQEPDPEPKTRSEPPPDPEPTPDPEQTPEAQPGELPVPEPQPEPEPAAEEECAAWDYVPSPSLAAKGTRLHDVIRVEGAVVGVGSAWNEGNASLDCLVVVRADDGGVDEWFYGGYQVDGCSAVAHGSDGGLLIAGYTASQSNGKHDAWVLEIDPTTGAKSLDVSHGGAAYDYATRISALPGGGFAFGGNTNELDGKGSFWLVVMDETGAVVSETIYDTKWVEELHAMVVLSDGFLLLGNQENDSEESYVLMVRTDADGNELAKVALGEAGGWERVYGAALLSAGVVAVAGASDGDARLTVVDLEGNVLQSHIYGADGVDTLSGFTLDEDTGVLHLAGTSMSFGAGGRDAWLLRVDAQTLESMEEDDAGLTFGGALDDRGHAVSVGGDHAVLVGSGTPDASAGDFRVPLMTGVCRD